MKNRLVKLIDKSILRKQALIESINDHLKNRCQIEYSRYCSVFHFLVNLMTGWLLTPIFPKNLYAHHIILIFKILVDIQRRDCI
ncbi:transposase [Nostoc sp. ChiQUE01b]|uniref:transposase n=1 Tax=Nostoc sp. ChiQUE01b TaxID=3075376 RepID=UPI002AD5173D|nr:transposase [Nostoc sp. ChiQUE01b]MDZ8238709.1 transposase [Nostoc sp. ChiQUE01a]MDZ8263553.1 transposase [Nostoc sp. ChiQUE01b]